MVRTSVGRFQVKFLGYVLGCPDQRFKILLKLDLDPNHEIFFC
jgi:hypothetical protein